MILIIRRRRKKEPTPPTEILKIKIGKRFRHARPVNRNRDLPRSRMLNLHCDRKNNQLLNQRSKVLPKNLLASRRTKAWWLVPNLLQISVQTA